MHILQTSKYTSIYFKFFIIIESKILFNIFISNMIFCIYRKNRLMSKKLHISINPQFCIFIPKYSSSYIWVIIDFCFFLKVLPSRIETCYLQSFPTKHLFLPHIRCHHHHHCHYLHFHYRRHKFVFHLWININF